MPNKTFAVDGLEGIKQGISIWFNLLEQKNMSKEAAIDLTAKYIDGLLELAEKRQVVVIQATVMLQDGTDYVILKTNLPSPWPTVDGNDLSLFFHTEHGKGEEFVKKNFSINPEVIDSRHYLKE
jgi:hypothetical protein